MTIELTETQVGIVLELLRAYYSGAVVVARKYRADGLTESAAWHERRAAALLRIIDDIQAQVLLE